MKTNRRSFLKRSSLAAAAAATMPSVWPQASAAQDVNSELTIAAIGVGGSRGRYNRGGAIALQASKHGRMIAVCDVDALHAAEFNKKFDNKLKTYTDYRKLFEKEKPDIVTIGTPDHWHVPIAIAALRAGCDVYCEKPLTLTIEEGQILCDVVRETKKVFQVGTQQRTEYGRNFLRAVALVRSGRLGKNVNAALAIGGAPSGGPFKPQPVPKELNWDMWLGPAPEAPYMPERRKLFRWWLEYSGGKMTDWGAHHIDIAVWALGGDDIGPVAVNGTGQFPPVITDEFDPIAFLAGKQKLPHCFNTAVEFNIDLTLANGATIQVTHTYQSEDGETKFGNGILFQGDQGRIFVNRGKLTGKPVEELTEQEKKDLDERVFRLYQGKQPTNHMADFFDCVRSRTLPISDVFTHHRTMTCCHLCNITLLLKRPLRWDPLKEEFLDDEQANALRTRPRRKPYPLEI